MRYSLVIAATIAVATAASATPIKTPPPPITALGGDVKAVYIFADAADTSVLGMASPKTFASIFCNHNEGTCLAGSAGNTVDLGTMSGAMVFTLNNLTTGKHYTSNGTDVNGNYHVHISKNYSDFGLGSLPGGAVGVLATLPNVTFVAWEDREVSNGSDFDYNDLVFAFSNTSPDRNPHIPEPLTLSLLGAGLLGAFGLRRVKKA